MMLVVNKGPQRDANETRKKTRMNLAFLFDYLFTILHSCNLFLSVRFIDSCSSHDARVQVCGGEIPPHSQQVALRVQLA